MLFSSSYVFIYGLFFCFLISGFWLADNWKELIQNIKSQGMKPGVAINPGTSVEEVYPLVCVFTCSCSGLVISA